MATNRLIDALGAPFGLNTTSFNALSNANSWLRNWMFPTPAPASQQPLPSSQMPGETLLGVLMGQNAPQGLPSVQRWINAAQGGGVPAPAPASQQTLPSSLGIQAASMPPLNGIGGVDSIPNRMMPSPYGGLPVPFMPNMGPAAFQGLAGQYGEQLAAPYRDFISNFGGVSPNVGTQSAIQTLGGQMGAIGRTDVNALINQSIAEQRAALARMMGVNVGAPLQESQKRLQQMADRWGKENVNKQLVQALGTLRGEAGRIKGLNLVQDLQDAIAGIKGQIPGVQAMQVTKPLQDLANEIKQIATEYKGKDFAAPIKEAIKSVQSQYGGKGGELFTELMRQRAAFGELSGADFGFGERWAQQAVDLVGSEMTKQGGLARQQLAASLYGRGLTGGAATNAMQLLSQELQSQLGAATGRVVLEGETGRQRGLIAKQEAQTQLMNLLQQTAANINRNEMEQLGLTGQLSTAMAQTDLSKAGLIGDLYGQVGGLTTQGIQNELAKQQLIAGMYQNIGGLGGQVAQTQLGQAGLVGDLYGKAGSLANEIARNRLAQMGLISDAELGSANLATARSQAMLQQMGLTADLYKSIGGLSAQGAKNITDMLGMQAGLAGQKAGMQAQQDVNLSNYMKQMGLMQAGISGAKAQGFDVAGSQMDRALKGYGVEAANYQNAIAGMELQRLLGQSPYVSVTGTGSGIFSPLFSELAPAGKGETAYTTKNKMPATTATLFTPVPKGKNPNPYISQMVGGITGLPSLLNQGMSQLGQLINRGGAMTSPYQLPMGKTSGISREPTAIGAGTDFRRPSWGQAVQGVMPAIGQGIKQGFGAFWNAPQNIWNALRGR